MDVYSLLKLRAGGGDQAAPAADALYFSAVANRDGVGGSDDDGPFFDLEFSVPLELKMNASSIGPRPSSCSTSVEEGIFFNGHLFTLESTSSPSVLFSAAASESSSKSHFPASVLKSATKFRVFMFRSSSISRSNSASASVKFLDERKLLYKDAILRYISKIKPLYVKVSKLRFAVPLGDNKDTPSARGTGAKKQGKAKPSSPGSIFPHRLKAVPGRLRKSRSASSAAAYVFSPASAATPRRDDSVLQQEDGIQSAIAHCKRSFHSEKGFWAAESPLLRSMSDPGGERSVSHGKGKGCSEGNSAVC